MLREKTHTPGGGLARDAGSPVPALTREAPAAADRAMPGAPSRRLRILMVYDGIYPQTLGGVEKRNSELAHALAARGHSVTLAGWTTGPWPPGDPVTVLDMGERPSIYTDEGRRSTSASVRFTAATARLDLRDYDVIEAANIPYLHLVPLALRARLQRRPLLVTWHEYWGRYWQEYVGGVRWPAYVAIEWLTAQAGARVLAVSGLTAGRLARHRLGVKPEVIPNGIPAGDIARVAATAPAPGSPLIYVGRLLRDKRLDLLIRSLALLPAPLDAVRLALVGKGPDEERLRALVDDLGLGERVVFRGRLPEAEDVWRELGTARVAVQPSSREGFGIFPLEAMAAGLPVIYCESPESALPELVRDGRDGICAPADAASLAGAIAGLLGDPVRHAAMAASARARAAEYDWPAVATRLERVFLETAGG